MTNPDNKLGGDILIIDDHPDNLRLLGKILKDNGHRFRPMTSGKMALRSVEKLPPELILLDIRMPEMDGFEVCRRLKANPKSSEIPVIFISAKGDVLDKVTAFKLGGVDYITKPFEVEEVLARINTHLTLSRLQVQLQERNRNLQEAKEMLEVRVANRTKELEAKTIILKESEQKFRTLVSNIPGIVYRCALDENWTMHYISEGIEVLSGYRAEDFINNEVRTFASIIHPDDQGMLSRVVKQAVGEDEVFVIDYRIINKKGQEIWVYEKGRATMNEEGHPLWLDGAIFDITMRKCMEKQLKYEATHDPLTGLYNRNKLEQRLTDEILRGDRYNHSISIFMLDIDKFKNINDSHGHYAGDVVLHDLAKLLDRSVRNTDYIFRYGGEEFIVVLPETPISEAEELADRLREEVVDNPILIGDDVKLKLTVSIGVATYPDHAKTWNTLVKMADKAMYRAKEAGRNCIKMA